MRMFQSVSGHSEEQLTSAQGQLYSSSKVSSTLFQTELKITDHRGHKFSPSLTLLSVQNSNRMASRFTKIPSFPSVFLQLLHCSRQHPSFSWQKLTWIIQHFLKICRFAVQFWFHCKFSFHEKRRSRQVWQWRDFPGPISILCCA